MRGTSDARYRYLLAELFEVVLKIADSKAWSRSGSRTPDWRFGAAATGRARGEVQGTLVQAVPCHPCRKPEEQACQTCQNRHTPLPAQRFRNPQAAIKKKSAQHVSPRGVVV